MDCFFNSGDDFILCVQIVNLSLEIETQNLSKSVIKCTPEQNRVEIHTQKTLLQSKPYLRDRKLSMTIIKFCGD